MLEFGSLSDMVASAEPVGQHYTHGALHFKVGSGLFIILIKCFVYLSFYILINSTLPSLRIGLLGIRDPPLSGHRKRPSLKAAAGCPEGEQARLFGPGGQRPSLQG